MHLTHYMYDADILENITNSKERIILIQLMSSLHDKLEIKKPGIPYVGTPKKNKRIIAAELLPGN